MADKISNYNSMNYTSGKTQKLPNTELSTAEDKETLGRDMEAGDHPMFIGPMFLHWKGSFLTYNTFFCTYQSYRMQESIESV